MWIEACFHSDPIVQLEEIHVVSPFLSVTKRGLEQDVSSSHFIFEIVSLLLTSTVRELGAI